MDSTKEFVRATRVTYALNRMIGILHAVRCNMVIWLRQDGPRAAKKYTMQMTYEVAVLTLRKFEDLWNHHLIDLLSKDSQARQGGEQILTDCKSRGLRKTANLVAAHYARYKSELPITGEEIFELTKKDGWSAQEELVEWLDPVQTKLISIRDEVMQCYGVTLLDEMLVQKEAQP